MKTCCFKLYKAKRNRKLHRQINAAGLIYNHCIALHKLKSRAIKGTVKTVTIKRDALGDIYLYFVCETVENEGLARTGKSVGYDFGLKQFLTASDGKDRTSPLFFKQNAAAIRRAGKTLARKKQGSNHRKRARLALARLHKKTANERKDFHFKLASSICGEYALVCIEDLNLKGMQKRWGRKISDYGFAAFVKILEYQASKTGTSIQRIDRYYASSQTCHICGNQNPETKDLRVREWTCPHCGAVHDRDRNAAKNILKVGASTFFGEVS